ncbi:MULTISPECIES: ArgS-related anticodon-binding protein NrtL [unclassified Streptomyces]|uniref:ArgS-related anticodon-binding protein NrtL n=1 Tax=unclassified Streptomyces TaxID=2593676 RepID=UPI002DD84B72|nr:DALR anticodon-binding domain-containing protein [Streptomyces sp. NBC_01766]WSC19829.1 DALR anticodon-binding domain-containing protein [Streptomyces sp. NBC_01766]WSV53854.1 DALR anticodon-binding domain-containing protein [Streptomyces sp. NBC_01014]
MTPAELSRTVAHAVRRAVDEGALSVAVPERVKIERPRPGGRGDYATSAALQLAGPAGMPPRAVAEALRGRIAGTRGIACVEITGPGFLNFTLAPDTSDTVVRTVREQGLRYGGGSPTAFRSAAPADPRLGADAGRWDALVGGGDGLLVRRGSNPLFRVQYAHARSRALLRNARDLGFAPAYEEPAYEEPAYEEDGFAPAYAQDGGPAPACEQGSGTGTGTACATAPPPGRSALLGALADYPAVVEAGAPHRLARHLVTVADAFLEFHISVLPVGDEKPSAAHRSRLALAEAAGTVLAGGLSLLGISAPEHI